MKRDVTNLNPDGECIAIIDEKTLNLYTTNDTMETYKLVTDTYVKTSTDTVSETPARLQCYTTQQISELPSQFDALTPIYETIAIATFLFILWVAYRLLLYPFFRKKI